MSVLGIKVLSGEEVLPFTAAPSVSHGAGIDGTSLMAEMI